MHGLSSNREPGSPNRFTLHSSAISMNRPRFLCRLGLIVALAGSAGRADAQSDPSPWRLGVSLGGGALVGVVAEYWSDDFGVEARLGTATFRQVLVRLSPKWRVGTWDGGEATWRAGVQVSSSVFEVFHGVELARLTDGGHVIGGSYNLPLFGGTWRSDEGLGDPDEGPEEDAGDPALPSSSEVRVIANVLLGEFVYRYQPQPGG